MRINTNISAINTGRHMAGNALQMSKSLERLSSGLRINRAGDDAAGLSISENLRAQARGAQQAMRNTQDGISLIRTADGGLNEIHDALQRCRELAVQAANGTNSAAELDAIQSEVDALLAEIDNISKATTFNGIKLLAATTYTDAERQQVQDALTQSMLGDGYQTVLDFYGITHQAVPNLEIYLDDSAGNFAAFVRSTSAPLHNPSILELHINMDYFLPNVIAGNIDQLEDTVAHEFVHALMADETAYGTFPSWFKEGTAEFLVGTDDEIRSALIGLGGDTAANRQILINRLSNTSWGGTGTDYAAAALATKYLHEKMLASGALPDGLKSAFMNYFDDTANSLDDLFALVPGIGYTDQEDFLNDFKANGVAWMAANVNLANADQGGIGGLDDPGGVLRDNVTQVTTTGSAADATAWNEIWMPVTQDPVELQTGANTGQTLTLTLVNATASALGVAGANLTAAAGAAITAFDDAIATVSAMRAGLGAQANQLEHTFNNLANSAENQAAAESRIRDTDMADVMTAFTRQQILARSSTSVLAQANMKEKLMLALLN